MGCVVTGAVNLQVIEKKDTGAVLDGLNRFFNEGCIPKICFPDRDGALMRALSKGEISIRDLEGKLHKEKGILFETCLPQAHYQHGRIERRIKMLQESLERSEIRNSRCTALGWQCIAKAMEREINNIPLGFLHHSGTANPLLRVLSPSLLKNSTYTDRAPAELFTIPDSPQDIMTQIEKVYNFWFQIWNTDYVPLIMDRSKWHVEDENLREGDICYFKLTDSKLASDWRLGKVEFTKIGADGQVREVGVSYKSKIDDDDWRHSVVERPARNVVKLANIEDTSLMEDMRKVHELAKEILQGSKSEVRASGEEANSKVLRDEKSSYEVSATCYSNIAFKFNDNYQTDGKLETDEEGFQFTSSTSSNQITRSFSVPKVISTSDDIGVTTQALGLIIFEEFASSMKSSEFVSSNEIKKHSSDKDEHLYLI